MLKEKKGLVILAKYERCNRCGYKMQHVQACHLFCPNCGSVLDCSDKGMSNNPNSTW